MSIPKNITKEHIDRALKEIESSEIPKDRLSNTYFLKANEKDLPPKFVISKANKYANNIELDSNDFNAVEAVAFLRKLKYIVIDKSQMKNIKIYKISPNSNSNATNLFSDNNIYFYWNNKEFNSLEIDDCIFFINRGAKYGLFTKLMNKSISTEIGNDNTKFSDSGKTFIVKNIPNERWELFCKFKVVQKIDIPDTWNWTLHMGQGESNFIYKANIDKIDKRIKYAEDLQKIFTEGEANDILNDAINILGPAATQSSKAQNANTVSTTKDSIMETILTAIKTKPFILLAGISGTGKSRLVRTLAYKTCAKKELQNDPKKPGNFELIPVRPNWHDSSELMGYVSRINGEKYITTSFLQFISKAWKTLDVPFFLCLDEMNLAPVEQYFAEYLSIIETRQVHSNEIGTDYLLSKSSFENQDLYTQLLKDLGLGDDARFNDGLSIPNNLIVIGTVNMDETTHSFSRKVLDRAMTFEMNEIDLNAGLDSSNNDWVYPESFITASKVLGQFTAGREVVNQFTESKKVIEFLHKVNNELEGTPFKIAYRVRDEFLIYCYYASLGKSNSNWLDIALDEMTSMKILSRIEGDETKTGEVLRTLQKVLTSDFIKSNSKLKEMETRLQNSGYTSFWS
ncbi:MAG: AAA family ATPase [Bacteroidota bacterium]